MFSYAYIPWIKPAQKILEDKILPTPESKLEVLKLVIERLTANDQYVYIGMDHFAKPTDELTIAQSAASNCNVISRLLARAPARTSTHSACRPSRRFRRLLAKREGTASIKPPWTRTMSAAAQGVFRF